MPSAPSSKLVQQRLVLADALQEKGDPRGDLIRIHHQRSVEGDSPSLRTREATLIASHAPALLGPLTEGGAAVCTEISWSLGYWRTLKIASSYDFQDLDTAELLGRLLAHPSAAHLERLHLGIPSNVWSGMSNWQPLIDVLAKHGCATLTHLELADHDDNAEISWCEIGDLSKLWKQLPSLTHLDIRGVGMTFGAIDAPRLQHLAVESGGMPGKAVRSVSDAQLPALEHLSLFLGTEEYGASVRIADCEGILRGEGLPALKHLGLCNGEIMGDLVAAVVRPAPVIERLQSLDLSMGTLSDEGAAPLLTETAARHLAHLKMLDVSENFLSDAFVARLSGALPMADASDQKDAHEYGDDEPWYYTSVAE